MASSFGSPLGTFGTKSSMRPRIVALMARASKWRRAASTRRTAVRSTVARPVTSSSRRSSCGLELDRALAGGVVATRRSAPPRRWPRSAPGGRAAPASWYCPGSTGRGGIVPRIDGHGLLADALGLRGVVGARRRCHRRHGGRRSTWSPRGSRSSRHRRGGGGAGVVLGLRPSRRSRRPRPRGSTRRRRRGGASGGSEARWGPVGRWDDGAVMVRACRSRPRQGPRTTTAAGSMRTRHPVAPAGRARGRHLGPQRRRSPWRTVHLELERGARPLERRRPHVRPPTDPRGRARTPVGRTSRSHVAVGGRHGHRAPRRGGDAGRGPSACDDVGRGRAAARHARVGGALPDLGRRTRLQQRARRP